MHKFNLNLRTIEAPRIPYASCSANWRMTPAASASIEVRPTKATEAFDLATALE